MSTIVNGQIYDHGDVEVTFTTSSGGLRVIPVESVSYSAPRESQAKFGHSRIPVARTTGRIEPEFEVSMLKENFDELATFLVSNNGSIFGGGFGLSVRYGTGDKPKQVDNLISCQLNDVQSESSEGTDGLVVTCPGNCNNITFNGNPLLPGLV